MKLALLITAYVISMVGANLSFKFAAQSEGAAAIAWFIAGNAIGFGCPVVITYALKVASPNLVYALCLGIGFAVLQICATGLFKESMSLWQWGGIACIGLGIILLQIK